MCFKVGGGSTKKNYLPSTSPPRANTEYASALHRCVSRNRVLLPRLLLCHSRLGCVNNKICIILTDNVPDTYHIVFYALDAWGMARYAAMPDGGIHSQITKSWRNWTATWRWKIWRHSQAVNPKIWLWKLKFGGIQKRKEKGLKNASFWVLTPKIFARRVFQPPCPTCSRAGFPPLYLDFWIRSCSPPSFARLCPKKLI